MGSCQPASRASGASPSRRSVLGSSDCCTDGAPARMPPGSRRHRLVKAADRLERDAGSAEAEIAVEPGAELPGMTADVDAVVDPVPCHQRVQGGEDLDLPRFA